MPAYPGFCGSSNTDRSRNVNAERTINLFLQAPPGSPRESPVLKATPCVRPFVVLGDGPVRALFYQDGRCFAVSGTSLYEIFASQTATLRGTATADGRPATIASNGTGGNQLFITSGGVGYIYSLLTNTIAAVTTNAEPVQMGGFSDGYFFALQRDSNEFTISALYDGTSWDILDTYQVSQVSDKIVALVESHRDLWALGSKSSTVWANQGDADTPFQPIPGVKIELGCAAPFSAVNLDNSLYWVGGGSQGARVVYRADGYTPKRVSNDAVEYALALLPRIEDAIAWAYEEEGHRFYVLYTPAAPPRDSGGLHTTWVYDVATDQWHERALWDTTRLRWEPHYGRCHTYGFGRHLVGDRASGVIYEYSLQFTEDTEIVL
jgi:hypothetical protein